MSEEHKILFTGTMGSGKTTAISTITAVKMVNTEAANTDMGLFAKATTTVGLDYGEAQLDDGSVLRLYGTPGQNRFEFMWRILARGALGLIILVDNSRPDPLADLDIYLKSFSKMVETGAVVVGVGRTENHSSPDMEEYYEYLAESELMLPVLQVDVRKSDDVLMLLDVLFGILELADD